MTENSKKHDLLAQLSVVNHTFACRENDLLLQIEALGSQLSQARIAADASETQVKSHLSALAEKEQAVSQALENVRQELVNVAREHAALEQELRTQLEITRAGTQALNQQLQAKQDELLCLEQERLKCEKKYAEQTSQARQEFDGMLRMQIQREREVSGLLLAIQQQADMEMATQEKNHSEQERASQRQHAEHEQTLTQQLQDVHQEVRRLEQERVQCEKEHAEQTRHEFENLLRMQIQREREVSARLLAMQQQANLEMTVKAKSHSEQERVLQRQHAEREQALAQQLQAVHQELRRLEQNLTQRENEHVDQTRQLRQELESLMGVQVQREQEIAEQAKSHNEQMRTLLNQHAEQEQVLTQQLHAEREASQKLQQAFNTLQIEAATIRNSLTWRLAASLRAVVGRVAASSDNDSRAIQEPAINPIHSETMSMASDYPTQVTQSLSTSSASSLNALLQLQDMQFIESAYQMLLKRKPDHEGFNYYIGRIRAGVPRIQILGQIMDSGEARKYCVEMPGLREAIRRKKMISLPLIGRVLQVFMGAGTLDIVLPGYQTLQNPETRIDRATQKSPQEEIDVVVTAIAETEGGLRLLADRSIDETSWLRYLGQVIHSRLITPLRAAGTPPPSAALVVIIDCSEGVGSSEERSRTSDCLSTLIIASEYPVKTFWYAHSDEHKQAIEKEKFAANLLQVVGKQEIGKCICDEDIVLVLRPGDEVRPEIHMALKYFGSFNAELTLIDMSFRENDRVYPVLLHAIDPIHASYCDYFFGRYAANGKHVKKYLDHSSSASPSEIGAAICSQLRVEDCRSYRHIAIPLLCIQTSNAELAALRETIVLERAPLTSAPKLNSSLHDLKAPGKPPSTNCQAPTVSAIICTKDCGLLLRQLLHRLEREPLILDIVIVSNNTTNAHAIKTLVAAAKLEQVTVLSYDGSFNFSRQCNIGAKHAKGDVLLFLNDDMAPVSDDWLQRLLDWMDTPRIVGPMLIYPNESVQHAGMHLGFNGVAGHVMRHSRLPTGDYGFFLTSPRRVSCLTGAALLMPKALFSSLNGFDPMLATYLQDVDFSLRALHSGCELVLDPRSIIMHMESVSVIPTLIDTNIRRTRELEYAYFDKRWGGSLKSDAWMNPLFDPMDESLTALRT